MTSDPVPHMILLRQGSVTAARERIERVLGVETFVGRDRHGWAITFMAPADVDLDFLRPDVLPPRDS